MGWKDLSFSIRDKLLARKISGEPVESIADSVGIRPGTLDRRLREWAVVNDAGKLRKPKGVSRTKWDAPPVFNGDATVAGDLHLPYLDYEFAELMLDVASAILAKPRRLIIAGDLFNMDAFSAFAALDERPAFRTELDLAVKFLEDALDVYDTIEVLLGNHELRFVYKLLGQVGSKELGKLVGVDNVTFYEYAHCILNTDKGEWRITHQRNYSSNAQSVGKKLAHKFRQHIITHHQHIVSQGFDDSGQSVIIDNGCLADPAYLDYANRIDNTAPVMAQSFVVVRDGAGSLFTNHPAYTDYSFLK